MTPPAAASPVRKSPVAVLFVCLVTISLLMFILLASYSPRLQPHGRSPHRRLKLHPKNSAAVASSYGTGAVHESGANGEQNRHAAPFDPAIAELERRLEDKEWEREHYRILHGGDSDGEKDDHMKEWEEFLKEEEDFINDDDRFNVPDRIHALFPKIDLNPKDGFVTLDELIRWNLDQARADQLHRSAREMELYDKNSNGIVSFRAFQALRQKSHGDGNSLGFPWWKEEHFNASDVNGRTAPLRPPWPRSTTPPSRAASPQPLRHYAGPPRPPRSPWRRAPHCHATGHHQRASGEGSEPMTNQALIPIRIMFFLMLLDCILIFSVLLCCSFLNPIDSENPNIINFICRQELRQRDKDGDGRLNFEEYFHGLHDHIHGYDGENAAISHIGNMTIAKERFSKLDKDNNGFISEHELEPVLDKLHLSERYYARQQATHAISEADKDHDGRLTLEEMIENPYAFYGSVYFSDDEDYFHEEFR